MQRYFIESYDKKNFQVSKDDIHHMKKVMRMKNGDQVICINKQQEVFQCVITDIDLGEVEVEEQISQNCELPVEVILIYALPKSDKFEFVLQKACELGVSKIVPLMSKRSIIKTTPELFSKKYDRFNKILKEAAEQSYRNKIPEILPLIKIDEVKNYIGDHNIVAYEETAKSENSSKLKEILSKVANNDTITIIVGCEGGFEASEITKLESIGFSACALGKRILRSETAPLYLLSAIGYQVEL